MCACEKWFHADLMPPWLYTGFFLEFFLAVTAYFKQTNLLLLYGNKTSPGGNTPQDTNCTATCLLSQKLFKLDEPDMQDTAGEVMYSCGPPTHCRAKAGRPARAYIQQLCEDTGCCPEDLPEAMNDREKWRERVRDIRATSTI